MRRATRRARRRPRRKARAAEVYARRCRPAPAAALLAASPPSRGGGGLIVQRAARAACALRAAEAAAEARLAASRALLLPQRPPTWERDDDLRPRLGGGGRAYGRRARRPPLRGARSGAGDARVCGRRGGTPRSANGRRHAARRGGQLVRRLGHGLRLLRSPAAEPGACGDGRRKARGAGGRRDAAGWRRARGADSGARIAPAQGGAERRRSDDAAGLGRRVSGRLRRERARAEACRRRRHAFRRRRRCERGDAIARVRLRVRVDAALSEGEPAWACPPPGRRSATGGPECTGGRAGPAAEAHAVAAEASAELAGEGGVAARRRAGRGGGAVP